MDEVIEMFGKKLKVVTDESDDERIRRKFIEALKECGFTHFPNEFTIDEAITWLEKQSN